MADETEIRILAPGVIRGAALPRAFTKRGRLRVRGEEDGLALLGRALDVDPGDLAPAPLHYLSMTGAEPGGYCLFAYPVHLHARREQLILMAGEEFELSAAEAEALMAGLRGYYPHWRIERTPDGMWFIIVDHTPDMQTTPLERVLGEDINEHLPRGADAMAWLKTLNEIQMILFESAVNERREAAGQPVLNSLWLWGGGRLPALRLPRWRRIVTDDPVTLGAARRAGVEARWLQRGAGPGTASDAELSGADTLWVCGRAGSNGEPAPVLSARQWQVLRDALAAGRVDVLTLLEPGYGELRVDRRRLKRWWSWR